MNAVVPFGLLVEPEQFAPFLDDPKFRIVDLSRESVFEQLHLPNAISVRPRGLVRHHEFASGLLPESDKLQALFDRLGITANHHVIAYDDEGGAWAGRLIWNLHCAGFYQTSLLNGGIHAWLAAGLPTSIDQYQIEPVANIFQIDLSAKQDYQIEYDELAQIVAEQNITARSVQLWDCRTEDEYTGLRLAARRGGHIPNARHFEWSTALNRENHLKLHALERTQQRLEQQGFNLQEPVVVYCQSHHRSGLAYILGRVLGWNIRAYDGAWSEWGNRLDSPVITGELPS